MRHPNPDNTNLSTVSNLREVRGSEANPDLQAEDEEDDSDEDWQPEDSSDESVRGTPTRLPTIDRKSTDQRRYSTDSDPDLRLLSKRWIASHAGPHNLSEAAQSCLRDLSWIGLVINAANENQRITGEFILYVYTVSSFNLLQLGKGKQRIAQVQGWLSA